MWFGLGLLESFSFLCFPPFLPNLNDAVYYTFIIHTNFNGSVYFPECIPGPVTWRGFCIWMGSPPVPEAGQPLRSGSLLELPDQPRGQPFGSNLSLHNICITSLTAFPPTPRDKAEHSRKFHYRLRQFTSWLENIKPQLNRNSRQLSNLDSVPCNPYASVSLLK